jgi:hypothetical protein
MIVKPSKIKKLLEGKTSNKKNFAHEEERNHYWIRGSGYVEVPKARVNEIPLVIREYHERDIKRDRLLAMIRR